ncbi:3-oxoacyl-ACP reductase family protein [Tsukamurella paurometabola]|uniref:3-oxoacyl-[acyl-carrier-protein] reductase MabA n=1 Tax=Tsukamurella paurometabola TaxID=2061 RepID=A0A3P8MA33_TSUPA|nr:3-oxoacyl-ACP reductase family protein [Tsukamurella paurometabola]UEA85102.1 3-oxoacyl-ACP reductase FabG [Tsukamurella paurometabola]VDR37710.1 3-oxoacyl-[acyl-carrier-protein] reductase FabG [Tsukamurella paurometabola]
MTTAIPTRTDDLTGQVAFVTGGTRGIGAAIARRLAEQGASVAVGHSRESTQADAFIDELRDLTAASGATASGHVGNVGNADDCRRTVAEVIDTHGRLDILVNNAGITADKVILDLTDEDWESVLRVNLSGSFYIAQAALAHMVDRGTGRIINLSSVVGETGNVGQANYASSKSGLFGLTKTLAREAAFALSRLGKLDGNDIGITVNTVSPGMVGTEMVNSMPDRVIAKLRQQIPVGRIADPSEVARVVHFLASDASGYITGQVWGVNGGYDM